MLENVSLYPAPASQPISRAFDVRSKGIKIAHFVQSLLRELAFSGQYLFRRFIYSPHTYDKPGKPINAQKQSHGLVVLIHGLDDAPSVWTSQIKHIQKEGGVDIYAPFVHKRGVCSLEDASQELLTRISEYTKQHPDRPICLLGTSNGSRIATFLETELREKAPTTPIKVSTIAGIHLGSSRANTFHWLPGKRKVFQEIGYRSKKAEALLTKVRAPTNADRNYEFYGTTEDLMVPNLDSSLPHLGKGERHHVLHGYGHGSIVAAVAPHQVRSCLDWIQSR